MLKGLFGYNEEKILRNRKPLVKVEVEVSEPIVYSDTHYETSLNRGTRVQVMIYADGEADLSFGDIDTGGGFVEASAPLKMYRGQVRPVRVLNIYANQPYSPPIREALNRLNQIYNLGV